MKLPAAFLLVILICLPILAQTANPQQSSTQSQQPARLQEATGSNASSDSGKSNGVEAWRKIKANTAKIPEGATAQCNDLTYSSSQHVSDACAKHSGVKKWLKPVTFE